MSDINPNSNSTKDIIDNLLVKEETGNLHYFQEKAKPNVATPSSNVSANTSVSEESNDEVIDAQATINQQLSEIATAPKDDGFAPDKQIKGPADDKAEHVFHPEDKIQIARLSESVPIDDSKKYSIEKIVDKLLKKQNLELDDNNKKLFTNLILDFFRNRKSVIATRELLGSKIIFQEKTLSADLIDSFLSIVKSLKSKIDLEGGLVVSAEDMKKAQKVEVAAIESISPDEQFDLAEVELEDDSSLDPATKTDEAADSLQQEDSIEVDSQTATESDDLSETKKALTDDLKEILPQTTEPDTLSDGQEEEAEGVVSAVKFGALPKGMNEDDPDIDTDIAKDAKDELDESLEEIKNIIPDIAQGGDENKVDQEEDDLMKELVLDAGVKNDENKDVLPQQDLHDVGQLMTEDDKDEDQAEDEFLIKKIKPADALASDSSAVETKPVPKEDKIEAENADLQRDINELSEGEKIEPVTEASQPPVPKASTAALPKVIRPGQTFDLKPKITDVQDASAPGTSKKHVLTGPVEELKAMSLKSFRFLGSNAVESKNKIIEKINLLEQDSYTKKVAGIKAWRESPVNQLYLNIGSESMAASKDIAVLINEKRISGEDALSLEEFTAISDLNKSLRF